MAIRDIKNGLTHVFVRSGTSWSEQAKLSYEGSLALQNDTLMIGHRVFVRSGGVWNLHTDLPNPPDITNSSYFGYSVGLDRDTVVVGNTEAGDAYVFKHADGNWTQASPKLTGEEFFAGTGDNFGESVAIHGPRIAVGAARQGQDSAGAVHVFELVDSSWIDTTALLYLSSYKYAMLGTSVAMDRNVVVAGAPAIYMDGYNGGVWAITLAGNPTATPEVKIQPAASVAEGDELYVKVSVASADGRPVPSGSVTLVAGSYKSAAVAIDGGSVTIRIPKGVLSAGSYTLRATYTPDSASSGTYSEASGTANITVVTKITPTLTVIPASSTVAVTKSFPVIVRVTGGTDNDTPTGTVILAAATYNSSAVPLSNGSATITIPSRSLSVGTETMTVSYIPDADGAIRYRSATGTLTVTVAAAVPKVAVEISVNTVRISDPLPVKVTVTGNTGDPTPSGTVTLSSGNYVSSPVALQSGMASITVPGRALALGSQTLTLSFTPDAAGASTYSAATGKTVVIVVEGSTSKALLLGDFTGDGKADIFWRHRGRGDNYLWRMNGLAVSGVAAPVVPDTNWQVKGSGDFDGSGKADLLWRNASTGELYLWLSNGNATSFTGAGLPVVAADWQIVGTGDFDADGRTDVLWRNGSTGDNYLWLMNGSRYSGTALVTVPDLKWEIAAVADFNGDSKADILWYNSATGEVYVWLMNGGARSSAFTLNTVADLKWQIAAVGDLNGDHRAEVVWRNQQTGVVYLWTLNAEATAVASGVGMGTVSDLSWQIAGVGDLDGDGRADLFWRNTATGETYLWLLNGAQLRGAGALNTISELNWQPY